MAIDRPGARVRTESTRGDSLRCNATQRQPTFRDTEWGRPRRVTGWSLRELSERTGIDIASLSRIERGAQPTRRQARRLLAIYDAAGIPS